MLSSTVLIKAINITYVPPPPPAARHWLRRSPVRRPYPSFATSSGKYVIFRSSKSSRYAWFWTRQFWKITASHDSCGIQNHFSFQNHFSSNMWKQQSFVSLQQSLFSLAVINRHCPPISQFIFIFFTFLLRLFAIFRKIFCEWLTLTRLRQWLRFVVTVVRWGRGAVLILRYLSILPSTWI